MRLGYFGGSFDPPHLGHLAVACAAADSYALDRVLLVPTANQPLKPGGASASYDDRLAMVSLLCKSDARLQASDIEAPVIETPAIRPRPNYTIDTLHSLHEKHPAADLFVIVGADAFHQLPQWRQPDELLKIAQWIVVTRPHAAPDGRSLPPPTAQQRTRIHRLTTVDHPASATNIREELAHGGSCVGALSPDLLAYIHEHRLYT